MVSLVVRLVITLCFQCELCNAEDHGSVYLCAVCLLWLVGYLTGIVCITANQAGHSPGKIREFKSGQRKMCSCVFSITTNIVLDIK